MAAMRPMPSIYTPDFIAANQEERADNVITGTLQHKLDTLRGNIRDFKATHGLDKVIVLWTATTERYAEIVTGLNDTADNLLAAVAADKTQFVAPSTVFAMAAVLEGSPYINGSPQNTFVPGMIELAERHRVPIAGDDFKSGQTKMKSVLAEFLIDSGIKPVSIVSYNHLGNNDGCNLSSPAQFRSKEISKASVVDDMVGGNEILYPPGTTCCKASGKHVDHTVVIKYVPYVGDSKRAVDEYTSEIFMKGRNTISMFNVCEDSLLASPLIIDLVLVAELASRMSYAIDGGETQSFHPVLALLAYYLKAPRYPDQSKVVNALSKQRLNLENFLRVAAGLPQETHLRIAHMMGRESLSTDVRSSAAAVAAMDSD
eukprot:gnl/Ergobibamus_cyprinoides/594.p1 GENE.gnl/Ergobibamus_cyprinoides/594~~gnl/Ergobibamus_cyprinoides/594.p1  ORF type:complete len:372 (+),score=157.03 gnl/Ergobibamus_cyprinoides/594:523-1638(+)